MALRWLLLALLCLALGASACGSESPEGSSGDAVEAQPSDTSGADRPEEPAPEPEPSVDDYDESAKALAVIDGEGDTDLRAVQQRSRALDVLQKKCPGEERSRLADYATVTKQESKKEGVELTTLQALRGVNKSIPPSQKGKVKCQDQFVAYIALVTSGASP